MRHLEYGCGIIQNYDVEIEELGRIQLDFAVRIRRVMAAGTENLCLG